MTRRTRTIREGDAKRAAARAAKATSAMADETARHRVAMQDIAARRSEAALRPDAAVRAAALARVAAAAAKEQQRHQAKTKSIKTMNNKK
ncbi:hypothetical protein VQ02_11690 [Methylobacterium variabile]|jgi:hypothetical protein|uniref:Uncharacterized protein n=1 Tax=Methylobacterium variabile TaxID=298794 RepID=A0A0J6STK8_9HYPH|nr:hypothetical protein [Methylobacterium variabile]KMO38585.1 hypothetical protein VQ02_11690 [Methylobacterium variabile]